MEFSGAALPPIDQSFLIFFAVSVGLLVLIACAGLPTVFRGMRREVRFAIVRRRRNARMLADPTRLNRDARDLEGVYNFDA